MAPFYITKEEEEEEINKIIIKEYETENGAFLGFYNV